MKLTGIREGNVLVIEPDRQTQSHGWKTGAGNYKLIRRLIGGGYVEEVYCPRFNATLLVDEDGKMKGQDVNEAATVLTVIDDTATPIYGHLIVGTLRASDLYRIELRDGAVAGIETLLQDLARIRDVAIGPAGQLYLLVEHDTGGRIIRLVPMSPPAPGRAAAR